MTSNAPGQLLGYTLQYPRALYHLLVSGPGDFVCIEVRGDVATCKQNLDLISEEDKSSIVGNMLTNKSTDLWKTFFNWVKMIKDNDYNVNKMRFILYCNQTGRDGIVTYFNSAKNQQDAQNAIEYAKKELNDINQDHEIWKYYDFVINQNESLLIEIIMKFELQIGSGTGNDEVAYEIRRKIVHSSQVQFLIQKFDGWLIEVISNKIINREPAIVSWYEFNHEFLVTFEIIRKREFIDYSLMFPCRDEDIQDQIKKYPIYLQQLGVINASEDELITAVIDFISAEVNRLHWIETEVLDEDVASDFESKLIRFWRGKAKLIELSNNGLGEENLGQMLFQECMIRKETIRNMDLPSSTIPGTYHTLADALDIGWHPKWDKIFPKKEENETWGNW